MLLPLVFVALALFAVACAYPSSFPTKGIEDFVIDDPLLAELFLAAAQEWTDAGVVAAARITVNVNPKGMKVKWSSLEDIAANCGVSPQLEPGEFISGCARHRGEKFHDTMWITLIEPKDQIAASETLRKRVKYNIMHEQMHVLLPTAWHVSRDQPAVMNSRGGQEITQADLDFISEYTEVVS